MTVRQINCFFTYLSGFPNILLLASSLASFEVLRDNSYLRSKDPLLKNGAEDSKLSFAYDMRCKIFTAKLVKVNFMYQYLLNRNRFRMQINSLLIYPDVNYRKLVMKVSLSRLRFQELESFLKVFL